MPIYEYYCPENHTIYQFFAKTLAQGQSTPKCPENPEYTMRRVVSAFSISTGGRKADTEAETAGDTSDPTEDARLDAAMNEMEREFSSVDENDPRAMARMMRRMAELTGEKIDGEMEEVVRKLEEGADPDSLEEQFSGGEENAEDPYGDGGMGEPAGAAAEPKEKKHRFRSRKTQPRRDPNLYEYE